MVFGIADVPDFDAIRYISICVEKKKEKNRLINVSMGRTRSNKHYGTDVPSSKCHVILRPIESIVE